MSKHLVICVHGIFTLAPWQKALRQMIVELEPSAVVHEYKYGPVSAYSLFPGRRTRKVTTFANQLLTELLRENWQRIDVVAHSFGTFIVAEALRHLAWSNRGRLPQIDSLILAGSVLPRQYPWREFVPHLVRRVVNDCGVVDHVLWLPELFVPRLGFGGRVGFCGLTGYDVHNRYFMLGHSGFFREPTAQDDVGFMRRWWLPLLTSTTGNVPEHDARMQRRWPVLIGWLERQVNALRVCVWSALITIPVAMVGLYIGQLQSLNRQLLAESWALQSLQQRDTAPITSQRLAIASAKLHEGPQTQHALLQALMTSARPVFVLDHGNTSGLRHFAMTSDGTLLAEAGPDAQGRLVVQLRSLQSPDARPTILKLPDPQCSQKQQPQRLLFSKSGRYLALEAIFGSCVLDTHSLQWTRDLPGYGNVTFFGSESAVYASRSPAVIEQDYTGPLLAVVSATESQAVAGLAAAGWLRDFAIVGESGAVFADAVGRAWFIREDGVRPALIPPPAGWDAGVQSVAASTDGQRLAIGAEHDGVAVLRADKLTEEWHGSLPSAPTKIRFSSDGRCLAALLADGTARVWRSQSGSQLAALEGKGFPLDLGFLDSACDRVLIVNRDAGVTVWSVPSQSLLARVPSALVGDGYAFNGSGSAVLAADVDGTATVWDTTWQREQQALHMDDGIHSFVVRGVGKYVAALGNDQQLRVWGTQNRHVILDIAAPARSGGAWRSSLDLSENGRSVATADESGRVRVWRPGRGLVFELQLPRLFSDTLDTAHESRFVLRSLPAGTDVRILQSCSGEVPIYVDVVAATGIPASGTIGRRCQLFDPATTWPTGIMSTDPWAVNVPLKLSEDGERLALAFLGDVLVFDVTSGRLLARFSQGYEKSGRPQAIEGVDFGAALVHWLAFSRNGRRLLIATRPEPMSMAGGNVVRSQPLDDMVAPARALALGTSQAEIGFLPSMNSVISLSHEGAVLHLRDADTLGSEKTLSTGRFIDGVSNPPWRPELLLVLSHEPVPGLPRQFRTPYVHADVFDSATLSHRAHLILRLPIGNVVLSPDGSSLLVEDGLGNVRIVDFAGGVTVAEFALSIRPRAIWFGDDGKLFYTSGGNTSYASAMSGENRIGSMVWNTGDLVTRLCSSLRVGDRNFSMLSRMAGRSIRCD
jgi:WD40 repeat protein